MLRLDKLEISGFKSFYEPAELRFPASLTAVVGPNGCGKSNISDAIIWVLGEHRASQIRGKTMEDVIFQGSARRRALGMGEVTLTLTTDNGHPVAEDGKITIHRRVFRSGESEFRLNGRRVRMKDIADILMDTGLGIRHYSVMEQGKIDLIISNKPQDRRRLIEEAAGITKYKTKRRAAELKLEETQANLLRIDDTLAEIKRNLNSLKRQASKARRHKELTDQLSTAKRALYAGKAVLARSEQEESERRSRRAIALEGEAAALLATQEAELAEHAHAYRAFARGPRGSRRGYAPGVGIGAPPLFPRAVGEHAGRSAFTSRLFRGRRSRRSKSEGSEQRKQLDRKNSGPGSGHRTAQSSSRPRRPARAHSPGTRRRSAPQREDSRRIARVPHARHRPDLGGAQSGSPDRDRSRKMRVLSGKSNETASRHTESLNNSRSRVSLAEEAVQVAEEATRRRPDENRRRDLTSRVAH